MRSGSTAGVLTARVGLAVAVGVLTLATGCSFLSTTPDSGPEPTTASGTPADAAPIGVGVCIDDPGVQDAADIAPVPCDGPHDFEAFASTRMPDGDYPGQAEANSAASSFCAGEFAAFVGLEYDASALDMLYFYPVEERWNAAGDREILCLVGEDGGAPVTGTLKDASR